MRFGGSWEVVESRDSRESFPKENGAMAAALNLEVFFFFFSIPCGEEPASRRFSFQKFIVLSI